MLFKYKAVDDRGINKEGEIDAPNRDMAISGLQRRGLVVISIKEEGENKSIFSMSLFERVSTKNIVILSRQISTLFEAQVSALKAFNLLATNTENKLLARKLTTIGDDLQAGVSISGALSKHPDIFSNFYVNMVRVGEETGKLNQTFLHLSEYLDRQYALTSKTRNALIYPAFVIGTFFVVMTLMRSETGKLNQTFLHLSEYLDRQYALTSKTRNALIYPAFVIGTFFVVMTLM